MSGRRLAVVVTVEHHDDPVLRRYAVPSADVRSLAAVVGDPGLGGFEMEFLQDPETWHVYQRLQALCDGRAGDDCLLVYFRGILLTGPSGGLYLATPDTVMQRPADTAVDVTRLDALIHRSLAGQVMIVLDGRTGGPVDAGAYFPAARAAESRSRVVITAAARPEPPTFAGLLADGIRGGAADRDRDGYVGIDEVFDHLRERDPSVRHWVFGTGRQPYVSKVRKPGSDQMGLIADLASAAAGHDLDQAAQARATLNRMATGNDRVAAAASAALRRTSLRLTQSAIDFGHVAPGTQQLTVRVPLTGPPLLAASTVVVSGDGLHAAIEGDQLRVSWSPTAGRLAGTVSIDGPAGSARLTASGEVSDPAARPEVPGGSSAPWPGQPTSGAPVTSQPVWPGAPSGPQPNWPGTQPPASTQPSSPTPPGQPLASPASGQPSTPGRPFTAPAPAPQAPAPPGRSFTPPGQPVAPPRPPGEPFALPTSGAPTGRWPAAEDRQAATPPDNPTPAPQASQDRQTPAPHASQDREFSAIPDQDQARPSATEAVQPQGRHPERAGSTGDADTRRPAAEAEVTAQTPRGPWSGTPHRPGTSSGPRSGTAARDQSPPSGTWWAQSAEAGQRSGPPSTSASAAWPSTSDTDAEPQAAQPDTAAPEQPTYFGAAPAQADQRDFAASPQAVASDSSAPPQEASLDSIAPPQAVASDSSAPPQEASLDSIAPPQVSEPADTAVPEVVEAVDGAGAEPDVTPDGEAADETSRAGATAGTTSADIWPGSPAEPDITADSSGPWPTSPRTTTADPTSELQPDHEQAPVSRRPDDEQAPVNRPPDDEQAPVNRPPDDEHPPVNRPPDDAHPPVNRQPDDEQAPVNRPPDDAHPSASEQPESDTRSSNGAPAAPEPAPTWSGIAPAWSDAAAGGPDPADENGRPISQAETVGDQPGSVAAGTELTDADLLQVEPASISSTSESGSRNGVERAGAEPDDAEEHPGAGVAAAAAGGFVGSWLAAQALSSQPKDEDRPAPAPNAGSTPDVSDPVAAVETGTPAGSWPGDQAAGRSPFEQSQHGFGWRPGSVGRTAQQPGSSAPAPTEQSPGPATSGPRLPIQRVPEHHQPASSGSPSPGPETGQQPVVAAQGGAGLGDGRSTTGPEPVDNVQAGTDVTGQHPETTATPADQPSFAPRWPGATTPGAGLPDDRPGATTPGAGYPDDWPGATTPGAGYPDDWPGATTPGARYPGDWPGAASGTSGDPDSTVPGHPQTDQPGDRTRLGDPADPWAATAAGSWTYPAEQGDETTVAGANWPATAAPPAGAAAAPGRAGTGDERTWPSGVLPDAPTAGNGFAASHGPTATTGPGTGLAGTNADASTTQFAAAEEPRGLAGPRGFKGHAGSTNLPGSMAGTTGPGGVPTTNGPGGAGNFDGPGSVSGPGVGGGLAGSSSSRVSWSGPDDWAQGAALAGSPGSPGRAATTGQGGWQQNGGNTTWPTSPAGWPASPSWQQPPGAADTTYVQNPPHGRRRLRVAGILLLALLLAGGAYLGIRWTASRNGPGPAAAPTATATQQESSQPSAAASPSAQAPVVASLPVPVVVDSIPGVGKEPEGVVVAPDNTTVYVADQGAKALFFVDAASKKVSSVAVPNTPRFLALSPDGSRLYVSMFENDFSANALAVIDTAKRSVIASVPTGPRPFEPAIAPDGRVWLPIHNGARVEIYDGQTLARQQQISVPPNPHWIDFTPDGTRAFTSDHESSKMSVIDTTSLRVLDNISVGRSPHSVAVTPDGKTVVVTNYDANTVETYDTTTLGLIQRYTVGKLPQAVIVSGDGVHAYVVNEGSDTLSVLDLKDRKVAATVKVGDSPRVVALSPDGLRLYVTAGRDGAITVLKAAEG
ncbi:beta-propeller fold lactonase family protein [Actinoplanes sp. NPDC020271]|uniref:beta-propeller fold lactonase family protein n=1 Tax=Actinoplanes sp. NPDC020271 TaxID=3363896 RepID=UPI003798FBD0